MKLKENITGKDTAFETDVQITLKGNTLEFVFDSKNSTFNSYSDKYNDALYNADAVEVFLSTGIKEHYYEIEVAPNNTLFLADITNDGKSTKIKYLDNTFLETEVVKYEDNYKTTIRMDLEKINATDVSKIELNCFRIETEGVCPNKNLLCLNPTLCGSFHKREFFVKLSDVL